MRATIKFALSTSVAAFLSVWGSGVNAQIVAADPMTPLKLSTTLNHRLFMRLGYTQAFIKTKSSDAHDVTGPVATRAELLAAAARGAQLAPNDPLYSPLYGIAGPALDSAMSTDHLNALGTPAGITAKAHNAGTPTLSLGYWLSDDHNWVVEAYVLAKPLNVRVSGVGVNPQGQPNGLNGVDMVKTKILPPMAFLGYHFGNKSSLFQPYLGVGGTYMVFFDTQATPELDAYEGGRTKAVTKNAFGIGPFAGVQANLSEDWHLSLSVGQVVVKTSTTLTTYNTMFSGNSPVLKDYSSTVAQAIALPTNMLGDTTYVTKLMTLVAQAPGRGGASATDLGTYVRQQDNVFTNTIVNFSVGRSF